MASPTTPGNPDPLQQADSKEYYQKLFDSLGEAYWIASDLDAKDQIQGARDAVYKILTAINQWQFDQNTATLASLTPFVQKTNEALEELEEDINRIVKNIQIASEVENAISRVLALAGKLT